jgi:hypothetical protein
MASPSVSFRISRSAEDLAGTLHLLSQRLVQLEQRLSALEGQRETAQEEDPGLVESLGNAERLLLDCRALLGGALDDPSGPVAFAAQSAALEDGADASASHQSPEDGGNLADHDHLIDGSLAPLFEHDSPDSFAA